VTDKDVGNADRRMERLLAAGLGVRTDEQDVQIVRQNLNWTLAVPEQFVRPSVLFADRIERRGDALPWVRTAGAAGPGKSDQPREGALADV
jgi:hypothetical protein